MIRISLLPLALALACRPCEDDCQEYVELAFASAAASGEFASTHYTFVIDADGKAATCEIDVAAMVGMEQMCEGDAVISISDGSSDDTTGGSTGGAHRILLRWYNTPEAFDLVVRDAMSTLVMSNTLTPAYQDQGLHACDGACEAFEREIVLPE